jgi:hypothetical protein
MSMSLCKRNKAALLISVAVGLSAVVGPTSASAQQVVGSPTRGPSDDILSILSPKSMALRSLRDKPIRDYQGLPIAGWMLYPSFFIGGTFDDNIFQSSIRRVSAGGLHLRPSLIAERDTGIHHTTLYTIGDFRIYPDHPTANITNLQVGGRHDWEARRDLKFTVRGEYDRRTDMYNTGLLTTPFGGVGFQASPQRYNQFIGSVSGLKSFDRFFRRARRHGGRNDVRHAIYQQFALLPGQCAIRSGRVALQPSRFDFLSERRDLSKISRQYLHRCHGASGLFGDPADVRLRRVGGQFPRLQRHAV